MGARLTTLQLTTEPWIVRNADRFGQPLALVAGCLTATNAQAALDVAGQREVNSAEQLIDHAGSRSGMSGTPYKVNCNGKE